MVTNLMSRSTGHGKPMLSLSSLTGYEKRRLKSESVSEGIMREGSEISATGFRRKSVKKSLLTSIISDELVGVWATPESVPAALKSEALVARRSAVDAERVFVSWKRSTCRKTNQQK